MQGIRLLTTSKPKTYFDLIEKVGSKGKYQFNLMLIFFVNWFVTGVILMSTAFLFYNKPFDCKGMGLLTQDCGVLVCQLPQQQWDKYIDENDTFKSIATDLGSYLCQNQFYLELTSSTVYLGALIGYIVINFFSDNFGRRFSMLLSWGIATVGTILLVFSENLMMVGISLFMAGVGSDSSINICFFVFSQVLQDSRRQKYSIVILCGFCFSALLETIIYMFVPNWRIVTIVFITIPAIIQFFLIYFYLQETPQFLIQKGIQPTLKSLNRIGKINLGIKDILTKQDIQNVIEQQMLTKQFQQIITPYDLFRYPSLRTVTIFGSIVSFCIYVMYYGPILIVNEIGFDIYISNIILQMSDFIWYFPGYFIIKMIPRQGFGYVAFIISGVCSGILIFVEKPQDCNFCTESIIEAMISFYFTVFNVYFNELYPSRARGLGSGLINAVGTLGSTISPLYLGFLERKQINVMIVFTIIAIIGCGSLVLLKETKGLPLTEQIEQIIIEKKKRRTQYDSKKYSQMLSPGLRSQPSIRVPQYQPFS